MASFNPDLWRDRAGSRLERELALGVSEAKANQKFYDDLYAIECIDRLVAWLKRRRIEVDVVAEPKGGIWLRSKKTIRLNRRLRPREQFHTLLHEAGHVLVDLSTANHTDGKYACGYEKVTDLKDPAQRRYNTTFRHRIDVLAEEIDAWHAGKKLAKRLGLHIDTEAYDDSRARALKTYVKWSLQRTADKPDDDDDEEENG